ncbi:MAG TPA: lysophospholipid acyltransferase family protein [Castellaniella sp.]|uniref:lysophospholipid acyltransferase family protein n=1 Tax=Castellaniella sp. TaxID=1955812 RepID=UPI002F0D8A74
MALFLFVIRAVAVIVWIVLGLATELLVFPALRRSARRSVVRGWSRGLMVLCGVHLQVMGQPVLQGPVLWVSNHVSWVDIFAFNSVRTTSFVAKSDIRRWPVIGLLVAWAGTLFIDRGHRQAVRQASQQMQDCFTQGDAVGLFPEGTTTEGLDLLPFHAGLFDAAVQAQVAVQPVALRFMRGARRAPELAFVGEQTLVANLWWLLGATRVRVECEFLPLIPVSAQSQRGTLAHQARAAIRQKILPSGEGPAVTPGRGTEQ